MSKQFRHSCFQSQSSKTEEILTVRILRDINSIKKKKQTEILFFSTSIKHETMYLLFYHILMHQSGSNWECNIVFPPKFCFAGCLRRTAPADGMEKANWCSPSLATCVHHVCAFCVPDPDFHVEIFHGKGFGSGEIERKLLSPSPLCHCWENGHETPFNWEEPRRFLQITGVGSR